jgi:hypothetical protein
MVRSSIVRDLCNTLHLYQRHNNISNNNKSQQDAPDNKPARAHSRVK